ncbi:MAG: hypothetical protein WA432_03460 [Candidatus Babeliaceae bacterium]
MKYSRSQQILFSFILVTACVPILAVNQQNPVLIIGAAAKLSDQQEKAFTTFLDFINGNKCKIAWSKLIDQLLAAFSGNPNYIHFCALLRKIQTPCMGKGAKTYTARISRATEIVQAIKTFKNKPESAKEIPQTIINELRDKTGLSAAAQIIQIIADCLAL